MTGSHPYPDEASAEAGTAALAFARSSTAEELVVLVSGGGSAIVEVPPPGVEVGELADLVETLMSAGTPIDELNTVRRALSQVKNGGLLAASPVPVRTLVISDVIDAPPSVVSSGPTFPVAIPAEEVERIVSEAGAEFTAPMRRWLRSERSSPETPHVFEQIADGRSAAEVMAAVLGSPHPIEVVTGEARRIAVDFVASAPSGYRIAYGETTVRVTGHGRGGRNTEAALAAAIAIEGDDSIVFGALTTDGADGSSGSAGAVVDGGTAAAILRAGFDPVRSLDANDSATALDAAGALVITGPTGTNVADLWVTWRSGR